MEYMRGWRALFSDPEWGKKLLVGSVLILSTLCIPIVGQLALAGYGSLALRRAVQGQDSPLPRLDFDFEYLGKLLGLGFKPFIAQMLWSMVLVLPIVMVFGCLFGVGMPIAMNGGGEAVGLIFMAVAMLFYFVAIMAVQIFVSIASLRASLIDDLGEAIKPKPVLAMTRLVLKELVIGNFVMMLISFPIAIAGMLALYVGIFPAAVVLTHIHTFFHAEIYRIYLAKGGQPLAIGPLDVATPDLTPAVAPVQF